MDKIIIYLILTLNDSTNIGAVCYIRQDSILFYDGFRYRDEKIIYQRGDAYLLNQVTIFNKPKELIVETRKYRLNYIKRKEVKR